MVAVLMLLQRLRGGHHHGADSGRSVDHDRHQRRVQPGAAAAALHLPRRRGQPAAGLVGGAAGTKSYAIVMDDSAAPITPYIYWIVFNIPQATTDVQAAQLPPGAEVANNSLGKASYDPPCPDSPGHNYRFTVYALNSTLNLAKGASTLTAWQAIANAAIARGRITARANP